MEKVHIRTPNEKPWDGETRQAVRVSDNFLVLSTVCTMIITKFWQS
ncbi:type II toxin-antitoxin system YafO family toxin [Proteus mirabilis]|nr:type II toxin-antitoxin system YafO family toxin [Proteus mirabilis]MDC9786945.1 type II toxin-antitoxin system YafO family toxin [Proteus mirabilis]